MFVSFSGFLTASLYTSDSRYRCLRVSLTGVTGFRSPLLTQLRMVPGLTMMPHCRSSLRISVCVPVMCVDRSLRRLFSRMAETGYT